MANVHTNPTEHSGTDTASIKDRVADAAKTSQNAVKEAAKTSQAAMMDAADVVAEKGAELAEQGKDQLSSFQASLDDTVRRNPTAAVLGAIGIGVLIGMSMRGRS